MYMCVGSGAPSPDRRDDVDPCVAARRSSGVTKVAGGRLILLRLIFAPSTFRDFLKFDLKVGINSERWPFFCKKYIALLIRRPALLAQLVRR